MKLFGLFVFVTAMVGVSIAQPKSVPATQDFAAERSLAKLAVDAHGGEKLKAMKTTVMSGTVDVTASTFPQPIPATFIMIFAGDKYRVEINNPFQPLKQAFDGTNTVTSIGNGFTLPPFNRVGFAVLQRVGETGFAVIPIAENKSKKKGFRVTTPEGYLTDFYLDEKTNQVKSYESTFTSNGRTIKTSVEYDKMRLVDGVTVPEKYVQRFDLDQLTFYAAFNTKQLSINAEVANDVFTKVN